MKLIVISSPINIESESETILLLFKADLKYFHLRKPNLSLREFEYFLDRIPKQYLNRVIIHQHHELIEKYPLKGVHYTQHLINFKYLDSQDKIHRSKSCHSIIEIQENSFDYDYVFLSPIYPSISKPGYQNSFDFDRLKTFLKNTDKIPEIIALGGINTDRIAEVKQIGFDGVAILGTIWQENTVDRRLQKFQEIQTKM
jgi:thiamine-phosphate pyrophosphorylase